MPILQLNSSEENKLDTSSSKTQPSIILTSCNPAGDKTVSRIQKPVEVDIRNERSSSSNGEQIIATIEESNNPGSGKNETIAKSLSNVFSANKKQAQNKLTKKEEKIKRKKEKSAAKKERKATKTLAIVLGNFTEINVCN